MKTKVAKVFMNGRSQAVRLPKEFRFDCGEVIIRKKGDDVILSPRRVSWDAFFHHTPLPSDDFMSTRENNLPPQVRDEAKLRLRKASFAGPRS